MCREEANRRERIRAGRKDELIAQGLELTQVHDVLRKEFPRPYLRGDSDFKPKQLCITGVGSAGASTSAAAQAGTSAGVQLTDQGGGAAAPAGEADVAAQELVAAEAAAVEAVAAAAVAQAQAEQPGAGAAEAPDAAAAAVAEFLRAGVPAGVPLHVLSACPL